MVSKMCTAFGHPRPTFWARSLAVGFLLAVALGVEADMKQETLEAEANQQYLSANWQDAAKHYESLTDVAPDNGRFWFRLGQSQLNLREYSSALSSFEAASKLITEGPGLVQLYFALAKTQAGLGQAPAMQAHLEDLAAAGGTLYAAVKNAAEFQPYFGEAKFEAVLQRLRPCQSAQHRAFDFWLGEWQVTSPTRPGWQARSSITLGNDGCTLHEDYKTPGGYAGSSVNFYDANKGQWHQTWVDNQGSPLYLDGNPTGDNMILSDGPNRITWTPQPDGRVRQHWEVTNDEGKTYTTAFDGYYEMVTKRDTIRQTNLD
jgi:tetratricopeptide (TPR) repeat protein